MKAVVYRGANQLRVETVPVPRMGPGDLLVRVAVCGVCPTDIKKIHHGTVPPPRIFGHETAGTIVRMGSRVRGFSLGQRVALHHHVPCGACHYCRHGSFAQCEHYKKTGITAGFEPAGGGYAEYVRVMPFVFPGVVPIPSRNTFAEGALLEPVNTVMKAIERLQGQRGDTMLVVGQGPIGLMFTRLLQLQGVRVIGIDLLQKRLELALEFGAWRAFRPDDPQLSIAISRATAGRGADAAVVAVPASSSVEQSLSLIRGGGKVLLFAHTRRGDNFPLDLASVCVDEKDFIGSYSSDWRLQRRVAQLVFSRKMDVRPLITHQFPLDQTAQAIELAAHPTPDSLKVVVRADQEAA